MEYHRNILLIGWGIFADISIIIAMYFKHLKYNLHVHAIIFFIINISSLVNTSMLLDINKNELSGIDERLLIFGFNDSLAYWRNFF